MDIEKAVQYLENCFKQDEERGLINKNRQEERVIQQREDGMWEVTTANVTLSGELHDCIEHCTGNGYDFCVKFQ